MPPGPDVFSTRDREDIGAACVPGGVQPHVKRVVPAFVVRQLDAVQVDRRVVVYGLKMQNAVRVGKRRQRRPVPGKADRAR